jgi:hypothetical protein
VIPSLKFFRLFLLDELAVEDKALDLFDEPLLGD